MTSSTHSFRHLAAATAAATAIAGASSTLTACGGGGGGSAADDCTTTPVVITYSGMIGSLSISTAGQTADAAVGSAVTYGVPTLRGLNGGFVPASCIASPTWSATGLPPGIAIDAATGAVTGTPTQGGLFVAQLTIKPASGAPTTFVEPSIAFAIRDPATAAVNTWDAGPALPVAGGVMLSQGGDLVEVSVGATSFDVSRSLDGGLTWHPDAPPSAPPAGQYYALSDQAGALYALGGGSSAPNLLATAWRYDGSTWQQQSTQVPFLSPDGENLALYASANALFAAREDLHTVWRSQDGGSTWAVVSTTAFQGEDGGPASFIPFCSGDLGGRQVIVTTEEVFGTGQFSPANLWVSDDGGATWTLRATPATGPFSVLGGPGRCFFAGGRMFIEGMGIYTLGEHTLISSSDLDHWDFQAPLPEVAAHTDGIVGLGGVIHAGMDDKTYTGHP